MAEHLPLLIFPRARRIDPPKGRGFSSETLHFPGRVRQVERLSGQLAELEEGFKRYKASISRVVDGLEPETVLVIEIAGSIEDFKQAIDNTQGLEWLGEWDIEDIEPSDDFYAPPKIGIDFFKSHIPEITTRDQSNEIRGLLLDQGFIDSKGNVINNDLSGLKLTKHLEALRQDIIGAIDIAKRKSISGKLFVSMGNERGLSELLALWQIWEEGENLPHGKTKWRDVFSQTINIRRWGIEETLRETGMIDQWKDLLDPVNPDQEIHCQIELFYRRNRNKRTQTENAIKSLLKEIDGAILSPFLDMEEIAFHAVKVSLPAARVRHLLDVLDGDEPDIRLFKFPGIMYFRPTGQSLVTFGDEEEVATKTFPGGAAELPPVAAILDGAPNLQHDALKGRLFFDDPDNLSSRYQPGERRHGTAMASLVVHGDLSSSEANPLSSVVYCLPVMEPNPSSRDRSEHIPDEVFFEDRVERAVRRMMEGEGNTPAQAPTVKIINLSIGDPCRPFIHSPSPWARLLDWLSWKYRVLFCVSSGNYVDDIDVGMSNRDFVSLSDGEKIQHVLKNMECQLSRRRLLSPAESLNALTVGAMHTDESGDYDANNQRLDLLPSETLVSPISRLGHGFRRSVKPEVLFPGGRQLYRAPLLNNDQHFTLDNGLRKPGQRVASDSTKEGELSNTAFTRGTSNAAALATRGGVRIYEVLAELRKEHGELLPDELMAVLIKTLLVHGARQDKTAKDALATALKNNNNSRRFKEVIARYLGYGPVNIDRVLACTEQRATLLGCGEIREGEVHEYRFPLPVGLSGRDDWRRMVVTMAWFTPINPGHRNLREAKLIFQPAEKWSDLPLRLQRVDADHNQVSRGTVQHEVLEGKEQISVYEEDGCILLHVTCKADATKRLDEAIPYGLAVTLEVAEGINIPIYSQIRASIKTQVPVEAAARGDM